MNITFLWKKRTSKAKFALKPKTQVSLKESVWTEVPHESHSFNFWLIFKIKRPLWGKQWHHSCQFCPSIHSPGLSEKAKTSQRHAKYKEKEEFWEYEVMKALSHSINSLITIKPLEQHMKTQECQVGLKLFLRSGLSVHTFNIMAYITSSAPACLVSLHPCLFHSRRHRWWLSQWPHGRELCQYGPRQDTVHSLTYLSVSFSLSVSNRQPDMFLLLFHV